MVRLCRCVSRFGFTKTGPAFARFGPMRLCLSRLGRCAHPVGTRTGKAGPRPGARFEISGAAWRIQAHLVRPCPGAVIIAPDPLFDIVDPSRIRPHRRAPLLPPGAAGDRLAESAIGPVTAFSPVQTGLPPCNGRMTDWQSLFRWNSKFHGTGVIRPDWTARHSVRHDRNRGVPDASGGFIVKTPACLC